jgi:hypothetical protein
MAKLNLICLYNTDDQSTVIELSSEILREFGYIFENVSITTTSSEYIRNIFYTQVDLKDRELLGEHKFDTFTQANIDVALERINKHASVRGTGIRPISEEAYESRLSDIKNEADDYPVQVIEEEYEPRELSPDTLDETTDESALSKHSNDKEEHDFPDDLSDLSDPDVPKSNFRP